MVVSNIFYFHPYLGKIPILTNIFQRVETTNQKRVWSYSFEKIERGKISSSESFLGASFRNLLFAKGISHLNLDLDLTKHNLTLSMMY